jgi:hypothetical protein
MTDENDTLVHVRCANCHEMFSYTPKKTDLCRPDSPNLICDACYLLFVEPTGRTQ